MNTVSLVRVFSQYCTDITCCTRDWDLTYVFDNAFRVFQFLESLITLFYYLCWQQGRQEMCRCCGTERCEFRAPRGCSAAMLRRHLAGVERADPHAYAAATQPLRRKRRNSTSLPSHIYACSQRCKVYFRMVRQSASFCRSREVPLPNEASYESAKTDFNLIYSG